MFQHLQFHAPDDKLRDLDNHVKILNDALQSAQVFHNDAQVDSMYLDRKEIRDPGCVIVRLMELKDREWYFQNNFASW